MNLVFIFAVLAIIQLCFVDASPYCKKEVIRPQTVIVNGVKVERYKKTWVRTCCKGYILLRRKCVPLCEELCVNSRCTAPNQCTCLEGYKRLNDHRCEPICANCKYGFCSAPGMCDCYKGYEKDPITDQCIPTCDPPCVNGYCSDHDFCTCHEGFKISQSSLSICIKNESDHIREVVEDTTTSTEQTVLATLDLISSTVLGETSTDFDYSEISTESEPTELNVDLKRLDKHRNGVRIGKSFAWQTEDKKTRSEINEETTKTAITTETVKVTGEITVSYSTSTETFLNEIPPEIDYKLDQQDQNDINGSFSVSSRESSVVTEAIEGNPSRQTEEIANEFNTKMVTTTEDLLRTRSHTESVAQEEVARSPISSHADVMYAVYIISAIALIFLIICVISFAAKYYHGKEYNIAQLEKTAGVAKYFPEKNNLITAW